MSATAAARSDTPREQAPYRVMLVDDSAVVRGIFRRTLEADPEIKIAAAVGNGEAALAAIARGATFDVVVLDIEMPVMDGLAALPKILEADPAVRVIMASTLTTRNAEISLKAMSAGAAEYIAKPEARFAIHSAEDFKRELVDKVKALGAARRSSAASARRPAGEAVVRLQGPVRPVEPARPVGVPDGITLRRESGRKHSVLCVGSSTGGPQALERFLNGLARDFTPPILITQHMPKSFTSLLAEHLARVTGRPCAEGRDGEGVLPGHIYVAPGGQHMLVARRGDVPTITLDDGPPENYCKPSVDPMLRSAIAVYGSEILMVMLTGMGHDGRAAAKRLVEVGGGLIAQDEATSVVWGMPGAVANAGICNAVLPLDEIAQQVQRVMGKYSGRVTA